MKLPAEIYEMLADMEAERRKALRDRIRADPKANKLTLEMDKHARYRYWDAGKDGRGRTVRFGYTTGRNVAGYFLSFREVVNVNGEGKRDQFAACKVRHRARALAERRWKSFSEK